MKKGSHLTEEHKSKLRFKRTEEQKLHCSQAKIGNKYRLGCKNSAESNYKNSLAHKGKCRGECNGFYGKKHTDEANLKNRKAHIGKKLDLSVRLKMSIAHKNGRKWVGRKHSDDTKIKQSLVKLGKNNPVWKGGISFAPYPLSWRMKLKLEIKSRDNNTCQLCGKNIDEFNLGWATHHIDYDKNNCDINNLILLCKKCHGRTNHNNRDEWTKIFITKLLLIQILTKIVLYNVLLDNLILVCYCYGMLDIQSNSFVVIGQSYMSQSGSSGNVNGS